MTRADMINDRLIEHCTSIGVIPQPLNADVWPPGEDSLGYWRFGWQAPEFFLPAGKFHVPFCAEIIAGQTARLSDSELDEYLRAVEFMLDKHITLSAQPDAERDEAITKLLYDLGPNTLALLNRVQLAALDEIP